MDTESEDDGDSAPESQTDPLALHSPEKSIDWAECEKNFKFGTLTNFVVRENVPRLIQVEYPGIVESPEQVIRTLGGAANLSNVLDDPKRKLELRFRPTDVYCNPAFGEGQTACGVLIKVRRRRRKETDVSRKSPEPKLKGIDPSLPEPIPLDKNPAFVRKPKTMPPFPSFGKHPAPKPTEKQLERAEKKKAMLEEEQALLEKLEIKLTNHYPVVKTKPRAEVEQKFIKLPPSDYLPTRSGLSVEVLGIVHRSYSFTGMCDYQYLPSEFSEEEECQVSIQDSIAPIFVDTDDILDPNEPELPEEDPSFLLPAVMSRLDRPMKSVSNFFDEANDDDESPADIIRSGRAKRVVFSHNINFKLTDDQLRSNMVLVPQEPLPEAIEDVRKRLLTKQLEEIKKAFERRPIWTRLALEAELGIKLASLKYLVPCVAYFCINGPWRSLWVRLGYDPRRDKSSFVYQLLDYRIPLTFRPYLPPTRGDPAAHFSYSSGAIPPKRQMFYQICDIHLKEVDEVIVALTNKLSIKNVDYNPRFGFIDEDTLEFFRYSISRYVELYLKDSGKVSTLTVEELTLPHGCTAPKNIARFKSSIRTQTFPFRMRTRPKKASPQKSGNNPQASTSSRQSESDASSLVGDLTIRDDLFRNTSSNTSSGDDDAEWENDFRSSTASINDDVFEGDYDDESDDQEQEDIKILGN